MKVLDVGFGNYVNTDRIVSLASFDSAPMKRLSQDAKELGKAIDVTCGHKCRSVIVTDSGHIVLSSLAPEELAERISAVSSGD